MRGFGVVARYVKRFLEEHGYNIHIGAWVDVRRVEGGKPRLIFDLQIGHWAHYRPPRRGVPSALYVVTEGPIPREARAWLAVYDYLFCPSRFVMTELEKIDLDCTLMPHGIDVNLFKPMQTRKWIDVLAIGIVDSPYDKRKFMSLAHQVSFPYNTYIHTRPTLPYEELPRLYNSARVYLSLSGCEAFNIPVIEANACGVPAVYNASCATRETAYGIGVEPESCDVVRINGIPYYMCKPNTRKMKEALERLMRDRSLYERLSREARQHALQYDYRRTFRPLLEVLPPP